MTHPEFRIEDSEPQIPLIDENEEEDDAPTKRNSIVVPPLQTELPNVPSAPSSPSQNNTSLEHVAPVHKDTSRSGLIPPNSAGLPPCPGSPLHSLETSLWSPSPDLTPVVTVGCFSVFIMARVLELLKKNSKQSCLLGSRQEFICWFLESRKQKNPDVFAVFTAAATAGFTDCFPVPDVSVFTLMNCEVLA